MCVALQAEAPQALPAVLIGEVEVPHQVLCGGLVHVQLVGVLLVEEAHFLCKVEKVLVWKRLSGQGLFPHESMDIELGLELFTTSIGPGSIIRGGRLPRASIKSRLGTVKLPNQYPQVEIVQCL